MQTQSFAVKTTAHFDRLMKKLAPKHSELVQRFEEALAILSLDPYNKSRKYPIKKLLVWMQAKANTVFDQGVSVSATTLRVQRWCFIIAACGVKIRTDHYFRVRILPRPRIVHLHGKAADVARVARDEGEAVLGGGGREKGVDDGPGAVAGPVAPEAR